MFQHEDVDCALRVVSCFFEPLGCEHRVNVMQIYELFFMDSSV